MEKEDIETIEAIKNVLAVIQQRLNRIPDSRLTEAQIIKKKEASADILKLFTNLKYF